jgi:hypothetical protein
MVIQPSVVIQLSFNLRRHSIVIQPSAVIPWSFAFGVIQPEAVIFPAET